MIKHDTLQPAYPYPPNLSTAGACLSWLLSGAASNIEYFYNYLNPVGLPSPASLLLPNLTQILIKCLKFTDSALSLFV